MLTFQIHCQLSVRLETFYPKNALIINTFCLFSLTTLWFHAKFRLTRGNILQLQYIIHAGLRRFSNTIWLLPDFMIQLYNIVKFKEIMISLIHMSTFWYHITTQNSYFLPWSYIPKNTWNTKICDIAKTKIHIIKMYVARLVLLRYINWWLPFVKIESYFNFVQA